MFWENVWNYLTDNGTYDHLNMDGSALISVRLIIVGLFIGVGVAAFVSVFNKRILGGFVRKLLREEKIHFEYVDASAYDSVYIEGIGNLYEYDCGPQSGWMYSVNGTYPGLGCSSYTLADGDVIVFNYTCDLGADLGADYEK